MIIPKRWWQWVLVYPTLFIALIANIPQGIDAVQAWQLGIPVSKLSSAKEQRKLWERNIECIRCDNDVYTVKTCSNDIVKVAACNDTGDIIVEVDYSDGKKTVRWIAFDTFNSTNKISSLFNIFKTKEAYAFNSGIRYKVLYQRWINNVYLYRRVKIGNICWDEIINTYTGVIEMRNQVDCNFISPYMIRGK
jgi:hypothetical protein